MDDLISRQAAIDALKNRWKKTRNYEGIGDDIAEECELYLKQLPSAQPQRMEMPKAKSIIQRFSDYQIEWLKSHCDLELEPMLETWVVRFLRDTADCFQMETDMRGDEDET